MKIDITREITFRTARSGGKGGQNVNKVETMVEGLLDIGHSSILSNAQKSLIFNILKNKINSEGFLHVRSQAARTQLENKQIVVEKMTALIAQALVPPKKRVATRPARSVKEKRLGEKKIKSEQKQNRQKIRLDKL